MTPRRWPHFTIPQAWGHCPVCASEVSLDPLFHDGNERFQSTYLLILQVRLFHLRLVVIRSIYFLCQLRRPLDLIRTLITRVSNDEVNQKRAERYIPSRTRTRTFHSSIHKKRLNSSCSASQQQLPLWLLHSCFPGDIHFPPKHCVSNNIAQIYAPIKV